MAQRSDLNEGDIIYAADINDRYGDQFVWVDNVDAGGHNMSNLADLTMSGNLTMSGVLDVSDALVTTTGTISIRAQSAVGLEGGQLQLLDPTGSLGWSIDNNDENIRFFRIGTSDVIFQIDNGTAAIKMFLGGSLKTLSLSGSNVIAT